jgi:Holliday junction resolvase
MSGGRKSRDKGARFERALVKIFQSAGFGAEKIPLSGACGGSFSGDISIPILGADLIAECKSRRDGFRELYGWLDGKNLLLLKADRRPVLVIVPIDLALRVAVAAERTKGGAG